VSQENSEAEELAAQATEVASKLKAGTWDSVQALALLSIAVSLADLAASRASAREA
jgi:hypothetical protein